MFELYKRFLTYEKNLGETAKGWDPPRNPQEALNYLRKIQDYRRSFFGNDTADILFGAQVKHQEYNLRKQDIVNNRDLYGADKEKRIKKLREEMWGDEAGTIDNNLRPYDHYREKLAVYDKDLGELPNAGENREGPGIPREAYFHLKWWNVSKRWMNSWKWKNARRRITGQRKQKSFRIRTSINSRSRRSSWNCKTNCSARRPKPSAAVKTYARRRRNTGSGNRFTIPVIMLKELKSIAQKEKGIHRRWFEDDHFELIVWYRIPAGKKLSGRDPITGFQLCYRRFHAESCVTWTDREGFSHDDIDDTRVGLSIPAAPMLVSDGPVPDSLEEQFRGASAKIPKKISAFVLRKLEEMTGEG